MIQAINLPQFLAGLSAVQVRLEVSEKVMEKGGAEIVARAAARKAPKRTGRLASSVQADGGEVQVGAPYGGYQEYGTQKMASQPFLGPGREASEPAVYAFAQKTLSGVVR